MEEMLYRTTLLCTGQIHWIRFKIKISFGLIYTNTNACSHAFRLHTFIHRYICNEPGVLLCKPSVCCSGNSTSRWINCMPVKRGLCLRKKWGNQFNKTGLNLSLVISYSWKRHKDQFLFQKGVTTHTPPPLLLIKILMYVCAVGASVDS